MTSESAVGACLQAVQSYRRAEFPGDVTFLLGNHPGLTPKNEECRRGWVARVFGPLRFVLCLGGPEFWRDMFFPSCFARFLV